jgi:hypothetical protein
MSLARSAGEPARSVDFLFPPHIADAVLNHVWGYSAIDE